MCQANMGKNTEDVNSCILWELGSGWKQMIHKPLKNIRMCFTQTSQKIKVEGKDWGEILFADLLEQETPPFS